MHVPNVDAVLCFDVCYAPNVSEAGKSETALQLDFRQRRRPFAYSSTHAPIRPRQGFSCPNSKATESDCPRNRSSGIASDCRLSRRFFVSEFITRKLSRPTTIRRSRAQNRRLFDSVPQRHCPLPAESTRTGLFKRRGADSDGLEPRRHAANTAVAASAHHDDLGRG